MNSKFNLIFQQVLTDLIKDIKDLKQFYKNIQYSLVDWKHNKSYKDVYYSDNIWFKSVRISNNKDIEKLLIGLNLSATASGDQNWTKDAALTKMKSCLKVGQKYYFIIQDNTIIGTVRFAQYNNSKSININDFAIFKEFQSKGLGRLSLIAIIKYILRTYKQLQEITLGVAKINKKAFNLYQQLGFDIIQKGKTYYHMQLNKKYFNYLVDSDIDKWMNQWKLLSPTEIIKYNCGICYDTAKMSDYYLTKWNMQHKNFFACSQRNYNDHEFNDATHTFTIYLDKKDNYWKWLEGSWQDFKNNNFKSKNYDELVNWILKALANSSKLTNIAAQFKKFPKIGCTLNEFGKWTTILNYTYMQQPDGNLQKYALDEIKNILNNPGIGYGYYNPQTNEIIDDNDLENPLSDSAFNKYKLQSFEDILTYKLGVCWDCTLVIDKLLTTANIKHINIFLYGGGDQYTTHTTTIYTLDNKTWYWCDGSWHIFGSSDKKSQWLDTNYLKLIERIKKEHQKTFNLKQKVYQIINYPMPGSTAKQFINNILKFGIQIF